MRGPAAALAARWPGAALLVLALLMTSAGAARAGALGTVSAFLGGQRSSAGTAVLVSDSFTGTPVGSTATWQPSAGSTWVTTGGAAGLTVPLGLLPSGQLTAAAGMTDVDVLGHLASPQDLGIAVGGLGVPFTARYGVTALVGSGGYLAAGVVCGLAACTTSTWWASAGGTVTLLGTGPAVPATSATAVRLRVSGGQVSAWCGTVTGAPVWQGAVPGALAGQTGAGVSLTSTLALGTTPRGFLDVTVVRADRVA